MAHNQPGLGQDLPGRDAANFRGMVKLYEEKHYKKALKMAETILKKYSTHGETTSMKGIICWYIPERKDEALEWAKKGLRLNLTSSTCWHVLGLLHRNGRDYNEAMKCFKQAVRLDSDNLVLARDLTTLQIHEGNVSGFLEMRKSLFFTRPGIKAHWTSYAFAQHVCGNHQLASRLMRTTINHFQRVPVGNDSVASREEAWENGELLLYEALLLEESGQYDQAVSRLEACPSAPDRIGRLEALGRLLVFLNRMDEAHAIYLELFRYQRANETYLLCALATHAVFRQSVIFPASPASSRSATAKDPKATIQECKTTDLESVNSIEKDSKFLMLSLYAFMSPELACSTSHGWVAQPRHVVFPGTARNFERTRPQDIMYLLLRDLTPAEERQLSEWFLSEIFLKDENNANDSALRLLLEFVSEEDRFLFYLDKLIRPKAIKGAPFFIQVIKGLCAHSHKAVMVQKLLELYFTNLSQKSSTLPPFGSPPSLPIELADDHFCQTCTDIERSSVSEAVIAAGQCICTCAIASLFDFTGRYDQALEYVEQAITNTPTLTELYQLKARILKHQGDPKAAADAICEGREMDLADRFLNTKSVKYLLAIDDTERASKMALYFSQDNNIDEMQSMLYELRTGESNRRQGELGLALKQFYRVVSHFNDMRADLFDFHWYCQRRGSFISYLKTLRMRNKIFAQQYYRRAVKNIISILLDVYDKPIAKDQPTTTTFEAEIQTPDVTKSAAKKKKKKKIESPPTTPSKALDENSHELKLLSGQSVLDEASVLVDALRMAAQVWPETHQMAYDIYSRQDKMLLMAQSLYRLWRLGNKNVFDPILAPSVCHFLFKVLLPLQESEESRDCTDDIHGAIRSVLIELFASTALLDSIASQDWKSAHDQYLSSILGQSEVSVEMFIATLKCVRLSDHEITIHRSPILGMIKKLESCSDLKSANALVDAARSTTIATDVQDFCKMAFPRSSLSFL